MLSPATILPEIVNPNSTLLSVCCGIGLELLHLPETVSISAVDIVPEYVQEFQRRFPKSSTKVDDAVEYLKSMPDKCFDYVSCIDGIEHLTKVEGVQLLKEAKRVAYKKVIIFTPQGHTENHPEHTWGIDGGDEYQKHLSGWVPKELKKYGYDLYAEDDSISPHGQKFKEALYICTISS